MKPLFKALSDQGSGLFRLRIFRGALALFLMLCYPYIAISDELDQEFFPDLPVITSASRLTESVLRSSSAVTVIDSAMIRASGFTDLAEVFRLVPGFMVAQTSGHVFSVVAHGAGWENANRLQLLIDGRSTYLSSYSAIDWNTLGLHLEDIDRIEVVRGPAASAYGSNSFAGAINIITRQPGLDDRLFLKTRYGNLGEKQQMLRHSGSFNDLDYRITASTRKNDGFDDFRDHRDLKDVTFSGHLKVDEMNALQFGFTHTHGETGIENMSDDPGVLYDRDHSLRAWSANASYSHKLSGNEEIKVNFFHNANYENDMTNSYLLSEIFGVSPAVVPDIIGAPDQQVQVGERTFRANRSDIELQFNRADDSGVQYVVGAGMRYDRLSSKSSFPDKGEVSESSFRAFGNVQFPLTEYLTANMGALFETGQSIDSHLSPRGSLNWHLSDFQSLRVAVARAYRTPSLLEQNFDSRAAASNGYVLDQFYLTEEDLNSEEITSYELGFVGRLQRHPVSWELKAYREEYRNMLVQPADYSRPDLASKFVRVQQNAGSMSLWGLEGEFMFRPAQNSFVRLNFNLGNGKGKLLEDYNKGFLGQQYYEDLEKLVPSSSFGILAAREVGLWQFNIGAYHMAEVQWKGKGDLVDAYNRVDMSINRRFPLSNKREIALSLGVQNLGNEHYSEFRNALEAERRYYMSVSFTAF